MRALLLGISIYSAVWAAAPTTYIQNLADQHLVATGRESYLRRCAGCHGEDAQGSGPAAKMLNPRPRNLVKGIFKFRTTPASVLPSAEDLMRTMYQGVLGTSMPSFAELSEQERMALVAYIRSLRTDFADTAKEQVAVPLERPPSEIFAHKPAFMQAASRGKILFVQACAMCHGDSGKGDGPSAADLKDSEEQPIRPADLSKPFIKSGRTVKDIYKAISLGLEGTPMPAFLEMYDPGKRWDLTAYVLYLRGLGNGIYTEKDQLP